MGVKLFFTPGRDFPVVLAPMAGVSDPVFRELCRSMGADFSYTEMVSAKGLHYNNESTGKLLFIPQGEGPAGVQLFGSEPGFIAEAVRRIAGENKGEVACIDINMGCPARKIVSNGEGSALMLDEALAGRIIEAAVAAAGDIPVSVKFRKGYDSSRINAVSFARMAQDAGASILTVHPRTREQMYSGRADWDIIAAVKAAVRTPVIGNGDVFSGADAVRLRRETGCDAVMVARGAMGNPFIFREIKAALCGREQAAPTVRERIETALLHARRMSERTGPHAVVEMRKHVAWYASGMKDSARLRAEVNSAASMEELYSLLGAYLERAQGQ